VPLLRIERGEGRGRAVRVAPGRPVVVGREQRNELPVKDQMASRRHFEVGIGEDGRPYVRDLRSSNGTFLNGLRLPPERSAPLEVEDKLQAGSTLFALLSDASAEGSGTAGELTGKTLGGYAVEERIGRGGMGTVYKAVQLSLERTVALKVLARDLSQDKATVERFLSEARAAGKLNHPHIVQVYDVGEEGGLTFYSMEFMERGSLEETLEKEGRLLVPRALEVAIDAAKGLEFAERQRIVHRDVKPANLMVNAEGVTKIGDLGIARAESARVSTVGARAVLDGERVEAAPAAASPDPLGPLAPDEGDELVSGSPLYMPPEQAQGSRVDHRADLYALGCTVFHLLVGAPPFTAPSPREVIQKHRSEPAPRLDAIDPLVPREVADLVARLLEKRPEDRYPGASALLEDLRALAARYPPGWKPGDPPAADAPLAPDATPAPFGVPHLASAGGAALVALALLVFGGLHVMGRIDRAAEEDRLARERAREEARRREEAARAAEEARVRALARKREEEAERALADADLFVAGHAEDLDGARERYAAVAKGYEGTAAAERALERARGIEKSREELERVKAQRQERERTAQEAAAPVLARAESGPLAEAQAVRAALDALEKAWRGTEVERSLVPRARKALAARIDAQREECLGAFAAASAAGDLEAAERALERLAREGPPEAASLLEEKRGTLAQLRRVRAAEEEAALARKRAEEMARIEGADDPERRRRLLFAEVERELAALEAALETPEGRERARARREVLRAEEALKRRLLEHVNGAARPALVLPFAQGIQGTAVKADEGGLTFQAKSGGGAIELKRGYETLSQDERIRFLATPPNLSPLERIGLAALLLEEKEEERARKELERAAKEAEKAGEAGARALAERLLSGLGEGGGK
jgi:serine/threonine protein kinase